MLIENIDSLVPTTTIFACLTNIWPLEELEDALEGSEDDWYI